MSLTSIWACALLGRKRTNYPRSQTIKMRPPDGVNGDDNNNNDQTTPERSERAPSIMTKFIYPEKHKREQQIMSRLWRTSAISMLMIWLTITASNMTPTKADEANEAANEEAGQTPLGDDRGALIVLRAQNESSHHVFAAKTLPTNQMDQSRERQNDQSRQEDGASSESRRPASGRQSRIYRIRAIGSNGSFAGSVMHVNPLQSSAAPARPAELGEESRQQPDEMIEPQFGARQQASAKLMASSGLKQQVQHQQQQQKPCSSAEAETAAAAEASSISASSQTLRLTNKQTGSSQATRGELDESLMVVSHSMATASNEPQQAAESGGGGDGSGSGSGIGGQADRPPLFPSNQQRSASVESILSLIDEFDSKITTNKTEAQLSCDSGEMVIRLNFTEPFKGIVYPDHNRLSPCRFFGDGHHNYELRLPLRGCGTRQVAPRVFVNDVIVRFHKTLELEEDEVKTLICRYPPPLDAANSNQAAGSGLVHELGGPADSSRPSLASTGENHLSHQPFELVDPSSGRPTSRLGIGQQPEIFGELLASPGSRQRTQASDTSFTPSNSLQSPAERILFRQHINNNNEQLLSTSSSGVKQLNSRLFRPEPARTLATGGDQRPTGSSANSSNYFDRLTSIELLFLISSLMFLVLLAFGLAGSYYCFSRRNHRESSGRPQLLGRHKRRSYFKSPTSLLAPATCTTTETGRSYHLQRDGTSVHPVSVDSRQIQLSASGGHPLLEQDHPYGTTAPNPASYYHRYLQQTQAAPSSPDDSDISGKNLLSAAGPVNGADPRTFNYLTPNVAPSAVTHYKSSTLKPYHHHRHHHHQQQKIHGHEQVIGRRHAEQIAGGRVVQHKDRPFGNTTLRSSVTDFQLHPNQQRPASQHDLVAAGANTLGRRANRPFVAATREPLASSHHYQTHVQHHHRSNNDHQHYHKQQPQRAPTLASQAIEANLYYAQMRHAKSLQQLRDEQAEMEPDSWRRQKNDDNQHQDHLNDDKIRQKQQQHLYDTSTLTRPDTSGRRKESSEFHVLDLSAGSSWASDSEIELTNDTQTKRPKLILKSIEDSFVTNLTEIYEQEYKKRDSTRQLSLAEWRSRQPGAMVGRTQTKDNDEGEPGNDHSRQTNMRSLTELDVDFAKSLLRPSLSTQPMKDTVRTPSFQKQQAASATANKREDTAVKSSTGPKVAGTSAVNSMDDLVISPEYNCGRLKLKSSERDRPVATGSPNGSIASHESISYV